MSELVTIKRVTVISEAVLENELIKSFLTLGAKGYTVINCRGKGRHDVMENMFSGVSSVRIELLVSDEVAEKIVHFVASGQYKNYAIIACMDTVQVSSKEHY